MKIYGEYKFATEYSALSVSKGYEEDLVDVTVAEGAMIRRCKDLELFVSTVVDAYTLNILTKVELRLLRNKAANEYKVIKDFEDTKVLEYRKEAVREFKRLNDLYKEVFGK